MAQTSRPERTRSLPNLYLEPRDKNFGVTAAFYLARICRLKKQLDRFLKIVARRFDRIALAGYVEFRAKPDIAVTFPLNNRGELLCLLHTPPQNFVLELVLEQRTLPSTRRNAKIIVRQLSRDAPAWSTVQKTDLHQERLVNLFDRVRLFGQHGRQSIHAHGPALIFFDNGKEQPPVHFVEAIF